jgi:hypothetical protein
VTGNWEITAQAAVSPGSREFLGSLEDTGSQVTGLLHVLSPICYQLTDIVPTSGAINMGSNTISLTSGSVGGQVLTISGVVSSDRKTLLSGTYAIAGGCGNGDHGTITGFLVPAFTNTYSGTLTSFPGGKTTNVTLSLTQSPIPDPLGFFHATGSATFVNGTCFQSGTLFGNGALVFGSHIEMLLDTNDGGSLFLSETITDSSGKTMAGTYGVQSGPCAREFGTAMLTHD